MEYSFYDKEKIFKLGNDFDAGIVTFDSLTDYDKCMLSKYYSIKNEEYNQKIVDVKQSLTNIDQKLDDIYNSLKVD